MDHLEALTALSKDALVELHRKLFGGVGDTARTSKQQYIDRLLTADADALAVALSEAPAPRKPATMAQRPRMTTALQDIKRWHDGMPAGSAEIIRAAMALMESQISEYGTALGSPQAVRDYLRLRMTGLTCEIFSCMFLDAQNRVIAYEEMFRGTLTQTSVFPREVIKRSLDHNAAAVVFAHNHPPGVAEPSLADEVLTQTLKHALQMIDVKVLDHFIVGGSSAMSFSERGLI